MARSAFTGEPSTHESYWLVHHHRGYSGAPELSMVLYTDGLLVVLIGCAATAVVVPWSWAWCLHFRRLVYTLMTLVDRLYVGAVALVVALGIMLIVWVGANLPTSQFVLVLSVLGSVLYGLSAQCVVLIVLKLRVERSR